MVQKEGREQEGTVWDGELIIPPSSPERKPVEGDVVTPRQITQILSLCLAEKLTLFEAALLVYLLYLSTCYLSTCYLLYLSTCYSTLVFKCP